MKTTQTKTGEVFQLWLDGASDLVKVWSLPAKDTLQYNNQRRAICDPLTVASFYGATEEQARKVILGGWPEGAKLVENLSNEIQQEISPPKSRRRTRKWSDDGDEISYERLQLGQDAWMSSHRKLRSACGLVEVVQSWGSDCGAGLEELKWSGAAALALTDLLEKADYSVELALVAAMHHGGDNVSMVRVDLKRMGELLDLEQLAAVAVYPPAWRIYGLCAFQQGPWGSGGAFNGHPHDHPFRSEPNGMWDYRPNVMTVTLGEGYNVDRAKKMVKEAIQQLESQVNPQDAEETAP